MLPSKVITIIKTAMLRLKAKAEDGDIVVHYKIVRAGGAAGTPRVVFGRRFSECSDAMVLKLYGPDQTGKDNPQKWFRIRGILVVRAAGGFELTPSSTDNSVLDPKMHLKHFKDFREEAAKHSVDVVALKVASVKPVLAKAADVSKRVDSKAGPEDPDEDLDEDLDEAGGAGELPAAAAGPGRLTSAQVGDAETVGILEHYNANAVKLAELLKGAATIQDRSGVDAAAMRKSLEVAGGTITALRDRGAARRASLAGALFGSTRFKNSLEFLDEMAARVAIDIGLIDQAYNALVVFKRGAAEFPAAMEGEREKREGHDVAALNAKLDDPRYSSRRAEIERGLAVANARVEARSATHTALVGMDMRGSPFTPGKQVSVEENFAEGMQASVSKVTYQNGETTIVKTVRDDEPVKFLAASARVVNLPTGSQKAANLLGRAVGTSRIAELLGSSIVPKTDPGVHMGAAAVVQGFVKGNASAKEKTLRYAEYSALRGAGKDAGQLADEEKQCVLMACYAGPIDANKVGGNPAALKQLAELALEGDSDPEYGPLVLAVSKHVESGAVWAMMRCVVEAAGVDVAAPSVQKSLADAHLMDLITGQFDRNTGNFIYTEEGGEVSARLIDNDMSFGDGMTDLSAAGLERVSDACPTVLKSLPRLVDAATARKILDVTSEALRESLVGTGLTDSEVDATVTRMDAVKAHLRKIEQGEVPGGRLVQTWDEQSLKEQLAANDNYVIQQRDDLAGQLEVAPLKVSVLAKDLRENGAKLCLSLVNGRSDKLLRIYTWISSDAACELLEIDSQNGRRMSTAFGGAAPAVLVAMKGLALESGTPTLKAAIEAIVAHRGQMGVLERALNIASRKAQQLPVTIMLGAAASPPVLPKVHAASVKALGAELHAVQKQVDGLKGMSDEIRARSGPWEVKYRCIPLPHAFEVGVNSLDRDCLAAKDDWDRISSGIRVGLESLRDAVNLLKDGSGGEPLWKKACENLLLRIKAAEDAAGAMARSGGETASFAGDEAEAAVKARARSDEPMVKASLARWDAYALSLRSVAPALAEARQAFATCSADLEGMKRSGPGTEDAKDLFARCTKYLVFILDRCDELRKADAKFQVQSLAVLRLRDAGAADAQLRKEVEAVAEIDGLGMLNTHIARNPKLIADIQAFQGSPTEETYWKHFNSDSNARGFVTGVCQLDQIFPACAPTILASVFTGNATRRFSEPLNHYGAGKDRLSFRQDHAETRDLSDAEAYAWHATYLVSKIPEIQAFDEIAKAFIAALA